jgi:thiol-disulfide isomerase/thioredoxin
MKMKADTAAPMAARMVAGVVLVFSAMCLGCAPGGRFVEVESKDQFQAMVLDAPRPVMVVFYNIGCIACAAEAPTLTSVSEAWGDRAGFVKISAFVAELRELCGVNAYPAAIIFKDGKMVRRVLARGYDRDAYEQMLTAAMSGPRRAPAGAGAR